MEPILPTNKAIHLLFAEDNELNRFLIKKLLEDFPAEIDFAENGQAAIEKVETNDYDIIFMDIHMPVLNGYKAAEYIRNTFKAPKKYTPIIAMTGGEIETDFPKCQEAGMNDYINKPFTTEELQLTIKKHLDIRSNVNIRSNINTIGDIKVKAKMVQLFLKQKDAFITIITEYYQVENWEGMYYEAHKMKSSADAVGLPDLKIELKLMEEFAKKRDKIGLQKAFSNCEELLNKAEVSFKKIQ